MRRSRAGIVACAVAVVAVALAGCGEEGPPGGERAVTVSSGTPRASGGSGGTRCGKDLTRFVASLDALRDQLAVGLTYDQYLENVERLRSAYGQIPVDRASAGCALGVGAPAERALNQHIEAANAWGNCLADASCEIASVEPEIKRRWELASVAVSNAEEALRPGA
jgi:hypothetical protein